MEFKMIHPFDNVYYFRDPLGVCFGILKGSKKAIVIDTGYGIEDIKPLVEKYIDTPYIVINTHGHMDHSGGNFRFEECYIPEGDVDLFLNHMKYDRRMKSVQNALKNGLVDETYDMEAYANTPIPKYKTIKPGEIIDLGNLTVEIIDMRGHTKGSIGLYVKEMKLLFSGDAAIHMIWMFLEESTDIKTYIEYLEKVKQLDFTHFMTGHHMDVFDKKLIDYYLEVAKTAKPENSIQVNFGDFGTGITYQYAKMYDGINIGICFPGPKK